MFFNIWVRNILLYLEIFQFHFVVLGYWKENIFFNQSLATAQKMPTLKVVCFDVSLALVSDTLVCSDQTRVQILSLLSPPITIYLARNRVFAKCYDPTNAIFCNSLIICHNDKDPWGQTNPSFLSTPAFHPRNVIIGIGFGLDRFSQILDITL